MKKLSVKTREYFEHWGRQGGERRTKRLSAGRRSLIASHAARIRWGKPERLTKYMPSVRLQAAGWGDPVYLEEILTQGGVEEWRRLYHLIAEHPFGETAKALEKVVTFSHVYGASHLWHSLLDNLRGGRRHEKENEK